MKLNPPPNWPPLPKDFIPPQGWRPDPAWGEPPDGWPLWVDDGISSPGPRRQLSGYAWFGVAVGVVAAIWLLADKPWQHTSSTHHVVYQVTGTASTSGLIDYIVAGGQQQENGVSLPWSHDMQVRATRSGASVYVSAQNANDTGSISCEIDIDGKQVASNTSTGAYAVVTCSAPLP